MRYNVQGIDGADWAVAALALIQAIVLLFSDGCFDGFALSQFLATVGFGAAIFGAFTLLERESVVSAKVRSAYTQKLRMCVEQQMNH